MMRISRAFLLAVALSAGGAGAHAQEAASNGAVVAAIAPGAEEIRLMSGERVRLAGIRVPPQVGHEAQALLEELVRDAHLRLVPAEIARDRYGRLVAHLQRADGLWLQGELLRHGLAQVATRPGAAGRASEMAVHERTAREAGRGLWSRPALMPIMADEASQHIGSFRIVRGRVLRVAPVRDHTYLNFSEDWRADFTLRFSNKELEERFDRSEFNIEELAGRAIEARGFIVEAGGPLIDVTHPEQIEVLE